MSNGEMASRSRSTWIVVALTALAALLRFPTLGSQSFWYDEVFTANAVGGSFAELARAVWDDESTPPLSYVVTWLWAQAAGTSDVALRAPSAFATAAMVPFAALAGRSLVSSRAGLIAGLLVAVSPMLVWYGQEARAYGLFAAMGAAALAAFARALVEPCNPRALAWWGVASALALGTHYFAVFALIPQAAWLFWRRPARLPVLASLVPTVAVGVALAPLALHQSGEAHTNWIGTIPLSDRIKGISVEFIWQDLPDVFPGSLVAVALGVLAGVLLVTRASADERRGALVALSLGGATIIVPLCLAFAGTDLLLARNVILAWLPLALFVAAGLGGRRAGVAGLALTGVVVIAALSVVVAGWSRPDWRRHDWRAVASSLEPGQVLVLLGDFPRGQQIAISRYAPGLEELPAAGLVVSDVVAVGYEFDGLAEGRYRLPHALVPRGAKRFDGRPVLRLVHYRSSRPIRLRPSDVVYVDGERPLVLAVPG